MKNKHKCYGVDIMSRSYKKHTCFKYNIKREKRAANKRVRKLSLSIPSGNAYKKIYQQYDICDYRLYVPFISYVAGEDRKKLSELYKEWYKVFRMK